MRKEMFIIPVLPESNVQQEIKSLYPNSGYYNHSSLIDRMKESQLWVQEQKFLTFFLLRRILLIKSLSDSFSDTNGLQMGNLLTVKKCLHGSSGGHLLILLHRKYHIVSVFHYLTEPGDKSQGRKSILGNSQLRFFPIYGCFLTLKRCLRFQGNVVFIVYVTKACLKSFL